MLSDGGGDGSGGNAICTLPMRAAFKRLNVVGGCGASDMMYVLWAMADRTRSRKKINIHGVQPTSPIRWVIWSFGRIGYILPGRMLRLVLQCRQAVNTRMCSLHVACASTRRDRTVAISRLILLYGAVCCAEWRLCALP